MPKCCTARGERGRGRGSSFHVHTLRQIPAHLPSVLSFGVSLRHIIFSPAPVTRPDYPSDQTNACVVRPQCSHQRWTGVVCVGGGGEGGSQLYSGVIRLGGKNERKKTKSSALFPRVKFNFVPAGSHSGDLYVTVCVENHLQLYSCVIRLKIL